MNLETTNANYPTCLSILVSIVFLLVLHKTSLKLENFNPFGIFCKPIKIPTFVAYWFVLY